MGMSLTLGFLLAENTPHRKHSHPLQGRIYKKPPRERDFATAGVSVYAVLKGIHFLRVHSVKINKDAVTMFKILNQE